MLLVKTYLDKSAIHGLGVFACEFIRKGAKVWRFVEGFDRVYSPKQFASLPKPARDYIWNYGYLVDGEILLTIDHDHHMNHSDNANTFWRNGHLVARRISARAKKLPTTTGNSTRGFVRLFLRMEDAVNARLRAAPLLCPLRHFISPCMSVESDGGPVTPPADGSDRAAA